MEQALDDLKDGHEPRGRDEGHEEAAAEREGRDALDGAHEGDPTLHLGNGVAARLRTHAELVGERDETVGEGGRELADAVGVGGQGEIRQGEDGHAEGEEEDDPEVNLQEALRARLLAVVIRLQVLLEAGRADQPDDGAHEEEGGAHGDPDRLGEHAEHRALRDRGAKGEQCERNDEAVDALEVAYPSLHRLEDGRAVLIAVGERE